MTKITYGGCLEHERIFHPAQKVWIKMLDGFLDYFDIRIVPRACNFCVRKEKRCEKAHPSRVAV
jgi:hypothetical protein